jgi:Uma2 family endonuclease
MATVTSKRRRPSPAPSPPPCARPDRFSVFIPRSAATLAGFRDWATSPQFPEHVRAAFIDGKIHIDMSNEDPEVHVVVKGEVVRVLGNLNRQERLGKLYAGGVLVTNEAANVSNNPDASFLSRETIRSGRARVVPREGQEGRFREIEGTPDWVLEVISDNSVAKDTEMLRRAYHAAGIPEYWLIDARGEDILFTILHRRKTGYAAAPVKDGWQRSKVFGRDFRLTRQCDEFGLWEYTLEVRPR